MINNTLKKNSIIPGQLTTLTNNQKHAFHLILDKPINSSRIGTKATGMAFRRLELFPRRTTQDDYHGITTVNVAIGYSMLLFLVNMTLSTSWVLRIARFQGGWSCQVASMRSLPVHREEMGGCDQELQREKTVHMTSPIVWGSALVYAVLL